MEISHEIPTVPCRLCSKPTMMLGTRLCDPCWELETRIESDPELARKILAVMNKEKKPCLEST